MPILRLAAEVISAWWSAGQLHQRQNHLGDSLRATSAELGAAAQRAVVFYYFFSFVSPTFASMLLQYNLCTFIATETKIRRWEEKVCFGWAAVSHEERHAVTICLSRWTWFPGNCIKAAGAFAIESRGLFKQRSQREQCSYHLLAGKITWPHWAWLSFWQLHKDFIQALSFLNRPSCEVSGGNTGTSVWFWYPATRVSAHLKCWPGGSSKSGEILTGRKANERWTNVLVVEQSLCIQC